MSETEKKQQGFTLTELLVVMGIIAIITAIVFPNIRLGDKRLALERSTQKLAQDVGKAAGLALQVSEFSCSAGSVSGYGVYFDTSSPAQYIIFVDCNNNQQYDSGQDGIFETVELESGVQISALSISPQFSVVFVPPDPTVFLNPGNFSEVQVTLQEPSGTATKAIKMNNRGLVDID